MIFIQFQNNLIQKLSHMKYHCQLINLGYFRGPLHHRGSWMDAETEYDDMSMKTDIILTRFSGAFVTLRFDGASCSETLLGFTSNWAYKPTNAFHADSPGVYIIEKKHGQNWWNFEAIDGSVVKRLRQSILNSFVVSNSPVYIVFCEPGTIHCRKQICLNYYNSLIRRWYLQSS